MSDYGLSPAARQDLFEIVDYVAADNPAAATRIADAIFDAFGQLAIYPLMGSVRPELTSQTVRFWPVMSRYLVVYRAEIRPIQIVRVFGPGRDVAALLR